MSNCFDVLAELQAAGFRVWVAGDSLAVAPKDKLTPRLAGMVREAREPLLDALRGWDVRHNPTPSEAINPDEVPVCERCRTQDAWQSLAGTWRCMECEPPTVANRIRDEAARLRSEWPSDNRTEQKRQGADEIPKE